MNWHEKHSNNTKIGKYLWNWPLILRDAPTCAAIYNAWTGLEWAYMYLTLSFPQGIGEIERYFLVGRRDTVSSKPKDGSKSPHLSQKEDETSNSIGTWQENSGSSTPGPSSSRRTWYQAITRAKMLSNATRRWRFLRVRATVTSAGRHLFSIIRRISSFHLPTFLSTRISRASQVGDSLPSSPESDDGISTINLSWEYSKD
jgi:hypothetical protein